MALIGGVGKKGIETQEYYLQAQGTGECNAVQVFSSGLPKKIVATSIDSGSNIKYQTSSSTGYTQMVANTEYTLPSADTSLTLLFTKTESSFGQKKAYLTFTY